MFLYKKINLSYSYINSLSELKSLFNLLKFNHNLTEIDLLFNNIVSKFHGRKLISEALNINSKSKIFDFSLNNLNMYLKRIKYFSEALKHN